MSWWAQREGLAVQGWTDKWDHVLGLCKVKLWNSFAAECSGEQKYLKKPKRLVKQWSDASTNSGRFKVVGKKVMPRKDTCLRVLSCKNWSKLEKTHWAKVKHWSNLMGWNLFWQLWTKLISRAGSNLSRTSICMQDVQTLYWLWHNSFTSCSSGVSGRQYSAFRFF